MKKQTKASFRWREHEAEYLKEENLKKLYIVKSSNDRYFTVLAKNKKQAAEKVRDSLNKGKEFNIPYLVPYTLADFYVTDVSDMEKYLRSEISQGCGCGLDIL